MSNKFLQKFKLRCTKSLLFVLLIILALVFVASAVTGSLKAAKNGSLSLTPTKIVPAADGKHSFVFADLKLNTKGQQLEQVEYSLQYNPQIVKKVIVDTRSTQLFNNAFLSVLADDKKAGTARNLIYVNNVANDAKGNGTIARLIFYVNGAPTQNTLASLVPQGTFQVNNYGINEQFSNIDNLIISPTQLASVTAQSGVTCDGYCAAQPDDNYTPGSGSCNSSSQPYCINPLNLVQTNQMAEFALKAQGFNNAQSGYIYTQQSLNNQGNSLPPKAQPTTCFNCGRNPTIYPNTNSAGHTAYQPVGSVSQIATPGYLAYQQVTTPGTISQVNTPGHTAYQPAITPGSIDQVVTPGYEAYNPLPSTNNYLPGNNNTLPYIYPLGTVINMNISCSGNGTGQCTGNEVCNSGQCVINPYRNAQNAAYVQQCLNGSSTSGYSMYTYTNTKACMVNYKFCGGAWCSYGYQCLNNQCVSPSAYSQIISQQPYTKYGQLYQRYLSAPQQECQGYQNNSSQYANCIQNLQQQAQIQAQKQTATNLYQQIYNQTFNQTLNSLGNCGNKPSCVTNQQNAAKSNASTLANIAQNVYNNTMQSCGQTSSCSQQAAQQAITNNQALNELPTVAAGGNYSANVINNNATQGAQSNGAQVSGSGQTCKNCAVAL